MTLHAATLDRNALPALDVSLLIAYMTSRKGWTPGRAEQAAELYRMFLGLHRLFPEERHALPADADEIWHAHLLHTERYRADCQRLLGRFLDHDPDAHIPPEMRRRSEARYRAIFGVEVICDAASA